MTRRRTRPGLLIPPAAAALALGGQRLLVRHTPPRRLPARRALTATLVAGGAALMATAALPFLRRGTTINPMTPHRSTRLHDDGLYAHSRNPIYLADLLFVAAGAVASGRWRSVAPLAAVWFWLDRVQIPHEEAALARTFGDDYADYCARVPRWL